MKIIAEFCQNHNGDSDVLKKMIETASEYADVLKIQTIRPDMLTKRDEYENYRKYEDEWQRLKNISLSEYDEIYFIERCRELNVESMTTLFTKRDIPYFNKMGYDNLKLSGYSIESFDYGLAVKDINFKKLYFSTSSLSFDEIEKTIKNLNKIGVDYEMMHCQCIYPTPYESSNIFNIKFYKDYFNLNNIGFSDHANPYIDNLLSSKHAIFDGATSLERHFTVLDIYETRDGKVSINKQQLKELRRFSNLSKKEQYLELNRFNDVQNFNHKYYRGRFV